MTPAHRRIDGQLRLPTKPLALTDDGAKMRIYVNGELVGTQPAIPLIAAKGPLTTGCLANYGNHFRGRIDDVRIYNRALDAEEVQPDTIHPRRRGRRWRGSKAKKKTTPT